MIKNSTRKTIITDDYKLLESTWSQARGLMFSTKPRCLLFDFKREKRIGLHMFFVFFPIDVLFLDKDKEVVELKEKFRPFTFHGPKSDRIRYIIELPAKSIRRTRTKVGDKIEF